MHLNLHLLRVFQAVVEHQGFSRAAESLFISQSGVSKAVNELERQLDLPLIERGSGGRRGVQLTDSGQALYEHARGIFAMERIALEEVRDRVGVRKGALRIGASSTVAGYWLPSAIARFMQQFPGIVLELVVGNTSEASRAVIDCRIDVGFVEGVVDDPRIDATLWKNEALQLVAAEDSSFARQRRPGKDALDRQTWLLRETGSGTRQVTQAFWQSHGIVPKKTVEIGSNEAIARAVAAGAGIAILPTMIVADLIAVQRMRAVTIANENLSRPLFQVELVNRPRSPALQVFLQLLGEAPGSGEPVAGSR